MPGHNTDELDEDEAAFDALAALAALRFRGEGDRSEPLDFVDESGTDLRLVRCDWDCRCTLIPRSFSTYPSMSLVLFMPRLPRLMYLESSLVVTPNQLAANDAQLASV